MKHFIDGFEVSPRNIGEIGLVSNFTKRPDELELNTTSIILTREAYSKVKEHISEKGFFEAIPYTVYSSTGISIDLYIDLQEKPIFRDFEVEIQVKKRKGNDNFLDKINGTSFELLAKNGVQFDSFNVDYIIVKDNLAELALTLAVSLYVMTRELIEQIKTLVTTITNLVDAVSPNIGFVSFDLGGILSLVLQVVAQLAFIALMVMAIIKLGEQLFELIFPKIRQLLGVKIKELLKKSCAYFGYGFSSSLLDSVSGLTLLPKPLKKQSKSFFNFMQNDLNLSFNKGYPTAQDTTSTVGSLFDSMLDYFNATLKIVNNTVYLELEEYWQEQSSLSVLTALNIQANRDDEYTVNTEEAWKRYYITYQPDISDLHTYDQFEGNDAEYSTECMNVSNADLAFVKGLKQVNIPFALGKRKDQLNWLEERAKDVFQVIDDVVSAFGGNSTLVSKIEARKGVLMISQQYFSTTKLLYTIGGRQPQNYLSFIRASTLWDKYHYLNQIQIRNAKIYENKRCLINTENFLNLLENNYADINGTICEVLKVEFVDVDTSNSNGNANATISYKEPYNYAFGKVQTITINS